MKISGSVALVTGANRGLGLAYARELVRRGAAKVYGAARDPGQVTEPGVQPVALDITSADQVQRAAEQCADVRLELHHQGTLVVAVHAGFIDTEMAALANAPKISPESVAGQVFDAVEAGRIEVLADERSRDVKAKLSRDHELIYPPIQEFWDAAVSGTS